MPEESLQRRVVGRYVLYGEIAAGGMATVHFGRLVGPVGFARTVAIKRLHEHLAKDPEFVAMFLDEARLAARISHPNVVPTLDVVAEEGELLLVMEYVQGESLGRLARAANAQSGVPAVIASSIFIGVLEGLHAAHEARSDRGEPLDIVHRDVSPQNVLVGVDGIAHVLDFGIAKAADRLQHTTEGQLKGKFAYMSPEQLMSGPVDRRTDVYATSVVLWETLVGARLFTGESAGAVVWEAINREIPAPSEKVACLPPALDAVVLKGLARDPNERFATAHEMAMALEDAVQPATPRRVQEWIRNVAAKELDRRAKSVAEIEVDSAVSSVNSGRSAAQVLAEASSPSHAGAKQPGARAASAQSGAAASSTATGVTTTSRTDALLAAATGESHRRKRLWMAGALVGGLLVLLGGLLLAARSGDAGLAAHGPATATSANGSTTDVTVAATSAVEVATTEAATASAATAASAPSDATGATETATPTATGASPKKARPTATPSSPPTSTPPTTGTGTRPKAPDCSNPFTIDPSGRKRPRPECF